MTNLHGTYSDILAIFWLIFSVCAKTTAVILKTHLTRVYMLAKLLTFMGKLFRLEDTLCLFGLFLLRGA